VLEYRPDVDPRPSWRQEADGLHLSVTLAQRYYNDRRWPDPVVVKLTGVEPALVPPVVETLAGTRAPGATTAVLRAQLKDLGAAAAVEVGFQYRRRKRTDELYASDVPWQSTVLVSRSATGEFTAPLDRLEKGDDYDYRAVVKHPLVTIHGEDKVLSRR